jgi:hypothetical protein
LDAPDASLAAPSRLEPQAKRHPAFFDRTDWLSFGVTTLAALTVYLVTLAPDVTLGSGGIFCVAGMYTGVGPPPGYPLSTFWSWAFIKLVPFGTIAWRVGLSAAVAGALSCGVLALMVSKTGGAIAATYSQDSLRQWEARLRVACGFSAGMVFGANGAFWWRAVIQDVWTLSILLLCLVLCLLMRWIYQPERKRYLYLAAFVYGLTFTNSQILLAFATAIPFLAWAGNRALGRDMFLVEVLLFAAGLVSAFVENFSLPTELWSADNQLLKLFTMWGVVATAFGTVLVILTRKLFTQWKAIALCTVFFLLGLVPHLHLPISSMTNPPVNWGYPRSVQGFYHVVTRGQFVRIHPTNNAAQFAKQLRAYGAVTAKQFGWPYLPFAAVPFLFMRRLASKERRWMLGLLAAYVCLAFLMLAVLNPSLDRNSLEMDNVFFSASYVVLAIWFGCGLAMLGLRRTKSSFTLPP